MEYVDFGKTGIRVSRFGLGCMRFPADEKVAIKKATLPRCFLGKFLFFEFVFFESYSF